MKINRFNEKVIYRKIVPVGDFLFHKFLNNYNYKTRSFDRMSIRKIPRTDDKYIIEIPFQKKLDYNHFNSKDFELFTDILRFLESYDIQNTEMRIMNNTVSIFIITSKEKIEEIEQIPEYKEWLSSVEPSKEWLEKQELKKIAKKYNV